MSDSHAPRGQDDAHGAALQRLLTWGLTGMLLAVAASLHVGLVDGRPPIHAPVALPWWLALTGVVAAERFGIQLHTHREVHTISLSAIPHLLGVVLMAPGALIAARLAGVLASRGLMGKTSRTPEKVAFNVGLAYLETVLGVLAYGTLLGASSPASFRGGVAAAGAAVLCQLVAVSAVTLVIRVHGEDPGRNAVGRTVVATLLGSIACASVVFVSLFVLWTDIRAALFLAVLGAVVCWFFSVYASLRQRHEDLQAVHTFTRRLAAAVGERDTEAAVLASARELLRAEIAEMFLTHGTHALRRRLQDGAEVGTTPIDGADLVLLARLMRRRPGGLAFVTKSAPSRALQRIFGEHGYRDGLVVPLQSEGRALGFMSVGNRVGPVPGFTPENARLFEIVAQHASVSVDRSQLVDRLQHDAMHDALTGLANRAQFNAALAQILDEAQATDERVGVLLMDLDRFKEVNDTLGHHHGDLLLRGVSERLLEVGPPGGLVARFGGDEFGMIVRGLRSRADVLDATRHVLTAFDQPFPLDDLTLEVGGSVGIALAPDHGTDPALLLQRADVAMYRAKSEGRSHDVYASDLDHHSPRRLSLAGHLRAAIDVGGIDVHFQPKAATLNGQVVGVEALARWVHPDHGFVSPDEFIPLAEQTGVIRDLTLHVLRTTLEAARSWKRYGPPLSVAVNLSARSLFDAQLPDDVAALLERFDWDAELLTLELTETTVMTEVHRTSAVLSRLDDLGVRISIDDFGTGYSSLGYLRKLPVDEVKIDRSFVTNLVASDTDAVIVQSTVDLAHRLGLAVVAEGVENQPTWDRLTAMGCEVVQGYHLSRPLSRADFDRWLRQREWPYRMAMPA